MLSNCFWDRELVADRPPIAAFQNLIMRRNKDGRMRSSQQTPRSLLKSAPVGHLGPTSFDNKPPRKSPHDSNTADAIRGFVSTDNNMVTDHNQGGMMGDPSINTMVDMSENQGGHDTLGGSAPVSSSSMPPPPPPMFGNPTGTNTDALTRSSMSTNDSINGVNTYVVPPSTPLQSQPITKRIQKSPGSPGVAIGGHVSYFERFLECINILLSLGILSTLVGFILLAYILYADRLPTDFSKNLGRIFSGSGHAAQNTELG